MPVKVERLGTPAPTAAMAASIMVAGALQIIAGHQSCKESKMHVFNLKDNEWDVITM